jgi:predicted Fe-Mo cluster-binding NifX family protein
MKRILVPVVDQQGLNARLAEHFGRASGFAVVDLDEKGEVSNVKTVSNTSEHVGGMGYAHDNVLELQPNVLILYGMGPRGLNTFRSAGVTVLKANADTVGEVIAAYKKGELEELSEGCPHAHHH